MIELTAQQEILLGLLSRRAGWEEITGPVSEGGLAMSRQAVWSGPIARLQQLGLVGYFAELPDGAQSGDTTPSAEADKLWREFVAATTRDKLTGEGWTEDAAIAVLHELARVGRTVPPPKDARYSGTGWVGQSLRQVNWAPWVVQGVLIPDPSGRPWHRAAPKWRAVLVWDDDGDAPVSWWLAPRGGWCPVGEVCAELELPEPMYAGMTLCVAWVLEAFAVLDQDAVGAKALPQSEVERLRRSTHKAHVAGQRKRD